MPKEAVDEFIAKVRPAYERAGNPGAFVVHQQPGVHSLSPEAFEAMFAFFQKEM